VYPDYLDHPGAARAYESLLRSLARPARQQRVLIARPDEVDDWWRARRGMCLEETADGWRVSGEGADRARIAFPSLDGVYKF
jgi:hypothetical protein